MSSSMSSSCARVAELESELRQQELRQKELMSELHKLQQQEVRETRNIAQMQKEKTKSSAGTSQTG